MHRRVCHFPSFEPFLHSFGPLFLLRLSREHLEPPCSGRSTRPASLDMQEMLASAEEALAACGVDGAVDVFGRSQGGIAALAFVIERPEQVRHLILANTASGEPCYLRAPGAIWKRSHPNYWRMGLPGPLYLLTRRRAPAMLMLSVIFRASWFDRTWFVPTRIGLRDWFRPASPRLEWKLMARHLDYGARLAQVRSDTRPGRTPRPPGASYLRRGTGARHLRCPARDLGEERALSFHRGARGVLGGGRKVPIEAEAAGLALLLRDVDAPLAQACESGRAP